MADRRCAWACCEGCAHVCHAIHVKLGLLAPDGPCDCWEGEDG